MDEEEQPDVFPFFKDEGDNDGMLQQVGEGDATATSTHAVPKAEQVLQKDCLIARLVMLVQLSVANVHLDCGREIASVGFFQAVELVTLSPQFHWGVLQVPF